MNELVVGKINYNFVPNIVVTILQVAVRLINKLDFIKNGLTRLCSSAKEHLIASYPVAHLLPCP